MPSPTANFATPVVRPDLRNASPADWPEVVFSTDPTNAPSSTLSFEHGNAIIRGSGAGSGVRSNRRTAHLVPGSPRGYGRMRSTLAGLTPTGPNLPQWGHMHGICRMPDGNIYGVLVWTDIILGSVTTWNFGVWRAEDLDRGVTFLNDGALCKDQRNVTAAARTGNVVTLTLQGGIGDFAVGDQVSTDLTDNTYDGNFELSAVSAANGTVTYAQDAANAGTSTGTIRMRDQTPGAFRCDRVVNATSATRATNIVTAAIGNDSHPINPGDVVTADFPTGTFDGIVQVRDTLLGNITYRQAGSDGTGGGAGTLTKKLPYTLESEWLPGGVLRARAWPDSGFGTAGFATAAPAGAQWSGIPPWESSASVTFDLGTLTALAEPDPKRSAGMGIVGAHLSAGSVITGVRYRGIECEARA